MKQQKKKKLKPPKGYDSWFEYDLHNQQLKGCKCHTAKVAYVQERSYEPDFIRQDGSKTIYIEAKGRFRDRSEARKYVDVKLALPAGSELVFVFWNPKTAMPGSQRRADGSRLTHGEWAELQGLRYFTAETLPKAWSK